MTRLLRTLRRALGQRQYQRSLPRQFSFESLETRRVPTANIVNGVLAIQGTNRNDVIDLSSDGTNYTVTINGQASTFTVAGVQSIDIKCGNGNDQVTIAQNVLVSCRVDGGNGNDVIHGSGGDDTLIGGNGKDQIDGGGGNDHISGGNGNDLLSGSDGNDSISGGNGDDVLHGDVGNDDLHGENGRDQLFGDDGNDLCDGGRSQNLLQGDSGHDIYFDHHGDALNTDRG
jgi:Ca2+-binding RTX toxin-like protein